MAESLSDTNEARRHAAEELLGMTREHIAKGIAWYLAGVNVQPMGHRNYVLRWQAQVQAASRTELEPDGVDGDGASQAWQSHLNATIERAIDFTFIRSFHDKLFIGLLEQHQDSLSRLSRVLGLRTEPSLRGPENKRHNTETKRAFSLRAWENLQPYLHADYAVVRELQRAGLVGNGTYGIFA